MSWSSLPSGEFGLQDLGSGAAGADPAGIAVSPATTSSVTSTTASSGKTHPDPYHWAGWVVEG
jgi:hypothetical protein